MTTILERIIPLRPRGTPSVVNSTAPEAPANMRVTSSVNADSVDLAWDAVSGAQAVTYNVRYTDDLADPFTPLDGGQGITATTFSDETAPVDRYRYYRVRAVVGSAESVSSSIVGSHRLNPSGEIIDSVEPTSGSRDGRANQTTLSLDSSGNANPLIVGNNSGSLIHSWVVFEYPSGRAKNHAYTSARINFRGAQNAGSLAITSTVYLVNADNAAVPTAYADFSGATRTAGVAWLMSGSGVQNGTRNSASLTPELLPILDTVRGRSGFAAGNRLVFHIVADAGYPTNNARRFSAYEEGAGNRPVLELRTSGTADTVAPPANQSLAGVMSGDDAILSWSEWIESDVVSQTLHRRVAGASDWSSAVTVDVTSAGGTYTDTTLTPTETCEFKITASDGVNTSGDSNVVTLAVPGDDAPVVGALTITPRLRSFGAEVNFTGDDNATATASMRFKLASEPDQEWDAIDGGWRDSLPLHRWVQSDTIRGFSLPQVMLEQGETYDIEVTVTDATDGGGTVLTDTVTLRDEPAAVGATTHYVNPSGSDSNSGTSSGAAWATIDKAITVANAGTFGAAMVVELIGSTSARYAIPTTAINSTYPFTLVRRVSPLTPSTTHSDGLTRYEPNYSATRAVITSEYGSVPGGGTWTQVAQGSLTGPATGGSFPRAGETLWKWTGAPLSNADRIWWHEQQPWATNYTGMRRLAFWKRTVNGGAGTKTINGHPYNIRASVAGWAEFLFLNQSYRFGYATFNPSDPNKEGGDIYLRLPGDLNPNSAYITINQSGEVATARQLRILSDDVRLVGLHFVGTEIRVEQPAAGTIIDDCLMELSQVQLIAQKTPASYPTDTLVLDTLGTHTGAYITDQSLIDWVVPWEWVKQQPIIEGVKSGFQRLGEEHELSWIGGDGCGRGVTVLRCEARGWFNGVSGLTGAGNGWDRHAKSEYEIIDSVLHQIADDCIEPDWHGMNWSVQNSSIESTPIWLSIAPLLWGPMVIANTRVWNLTNAGNAPHVGYREGTYASNGVAGISGIKYSENSIPQGRLYLVNVTMWSDDVNANLALAAGTGVSGGGGLLKEIIVPINCIWRAGKGIAEIKLYQFWVPSHNHYMTPQTGRGLEINGAVKKTRAEYLAYLAARTTPVAPSLDTASNLLADGTTAVDFHVNIDSHFTDAADGDLTPADTFWDDRGELAPGITDPGAVTTHIGWRPV